MNDDPNNTGGPFDQNYQQDSFFVYNPTMMVSVPSQLANSSPFNSEGILASCQSFFVLTRQGLLPENNSGQANNEFAGDIVFNNSMRTTLPNDTFSFNSNTSSSSENDSEGKVWLNLLSQNNLNGSQMGIAFVSNGNPDYDNSEDAKTVYGKALNLYSKRNDKDLVIDIQGVFDSEVTIPIGITKLIPNEDHFYISIEKTEGILNEKPIYLEDKRLGIIHNLRDGKYTFTLKNKVDDDRFILRFENSSTSLLQEKSSIVNVVTTDVENILISTTNDLKITQLDIIDLYNPSLHGKTLMSDKNLKKSKIQTQIDPQVKILFIKAILEDNSVHTKKVIR